MSEPLSGYDEWKTRAPEDDLPPDEPEPEPEECPQCGGRGYIEVYDGEVLCHVCGGSRP